MIRIKEKQVVYTSVTIFILFIFMTVISCKYYGIWSLNDYRIYREVIKYPPGKDLWFENIIAGHNLKDFTDKYPPHEKTEGDGYTVINYYGVWPLPPKSIPMGGMTIIAKNGKLIVACAGECTWQKEFFCELSEEDLALIKQY